MTMPHFEPPRHTHDPAALFSRRLQRDEYLGETKKGTLNDQSAFELNLKLFLHA